MAAATRPLPAGRHGLTLEIGQTADLDPYRHSRRFAEKVRDLVQTVAVHPVHDKAVGRQQSDDLGLLDSLQGPDPGVELLFGQVGPQLLDAAAPERRLHGFTP